MPDIDYGQVLEALNDKVDLSGSWSAPTARVDNLSLGANGAQYTAPADGYFYIDKVSGVTNGYIGLQSHSNFMFPTVPTPATSNHGRVLLPAKKGEIVSVHYNLAGETSQFFFVYAQKTN